MASLGVQPLAKSFETILMGAAGGGVELPSDDEFNRTSSLLHFDGTNNGVNNAFDDGSTSNHTITANGAVTQGSFGPFAREEGYWGAALDGNNDYITVADSADFDFGTGDFCVELFIFGTGTISNRMLITANTDWYIQLKTASSPSRLGEISFYTGSTEIIYVSSENLNDSAWHHIAITREGSNLRHFLDGTLVKTTSNSDAVNSNGTIYIGAFYNATQDWQGSISNVRVVKGSAVYTSSFTVPTSPLTAVTNTKLLTCQSNRFVDNSTSAHTVTPSGNPSISSFGPFLTTSVYDPAVNAASLYAPAYSDYLRIPNSAEFELDGDFSVEFWANLDEAFNNQLSIFIWANNDSQTQIGQEDSRDLYFYRGSNIIQNTNVITQTKAWNHVALCRSGSVLSMYCNGVRIGTASYTSTVDFSDGYVAAYDPSQGQYAANGYMSDLRILKGSSAYDASQTTLTIPTAPLTAITNTKLLLNMADAQAIDSAAQNNLTLYGNTKISTTKAKFGDTSMYFDGSGDYAVVENFTQLTGELTIEFWVNPSALSPKNGMFQQGFADGGLAIRAETSGSLSVMRSGVDSYFSTSTTISANVWTHIALVYYNGVLKCYINGTADSQTSTTSANWTTSGNEFILGTRWNGGAISNPMTGYLDDFRVSKMARYTSNFTAPTEPFPSKGQ